MENEEDSGSDELDDMDDDSQKLNYEEEKYSTANIKINKN